MTDQEPLEYFRISSHLKDIIGRDLVTNQFVAVFELVKNSVDAHADRIEVGFELDTNCIWIVDDGKGMSAATIQDRWLFVGYSAKAEGEEEEHTPPDYRDRISPKGKYGGSKGIGRFSCDTLGGSLELYSRFVGELSTHKLTVHWPAFEEDRRDLFQDVGVQLETVDGFPSRAPVTMPAASGTVLKIEALRGRWDPEEISRLRRYLEKLIDPFGTTPSTPVHISVTGGALEDEERKQLEGPVGNDIRDVLSEKTTRIKVSMGDDGILTELVDRGRVIYRISEENKYEGLMGTSVDGEVYYLNRAAKLTFKRRMDVRSVEFGSIFLFINGFRIFPIGEEYDDTLGLNRRKQQGYARYISTRDVMGRIDVAAPPGYFREVSSRDAGLIEDARVRD
ncbi:MAG: ATP-binding protein, partial [Chloroflexi bacterium]|nr:ATP-binding protein [Chloroflexota bacterium]